MGLQSCVGTSWIRLLRCLGCVPRCCVMIIAAFCSWQMRARPARLVPEQVAMHFICEMCAVDDMGYTVLWHLRH